VAADQHSPDRLVIRHTPEGAFDLGELLVAGQAKGFAGSSSAYFNDSELLKFAARLAAFPLPDGDPVAISGGSLDRLGGPYREHVGISVAPVGRLGQVAVTVHLSEVRPARPQSNGEARFELLTTYERLRSFASDLGRVVRGEAPEADLRGELLAGTS
jgi:hypothetical protein